MSLRRVFCSAVLLVAVVGATVAAPAAADDTEARRSRIETQRAALERDFAADKAACRERFSVTACVDAVSVRRRQALAALREQELRLDEAQRQQRARQRQPAAEARRETARARPGAASAAAGPAVATERPPTGVPSMAALPLDSTSLPASLPSSASALEPLPPARPSGPGSSAAAAAVRRAEASRQRASEAAAHQQGVQRALESRAGQGQRSAPLPPPPAASGAAD